MNTAHLYILAIAVGTLLLGCATTEKKLMEEGQKPLNQNQLESFFSQTRTYKWKSADGNSGVGTIRPDHTAEAKWHNGSSQAVWTIRDNKYCSKYDSRNYQCRTVYKTGEKEYTLFEKDGEFSARYIFTE